MHFLEGERRRRRKTTTKNQEDEGEEQQRPKSTSPSTRVLSQYLENFFINELE